MNHGPPNQMTSDRQHAHHPGPDRGQPDCILEALAVAGADRLADQRFRGKGKPVDQKRGDVEEMHEHGVGGEIDIAGPGTARGEPREGKDQADGADHDVAIDGERAPQLGLVPHALPVDRDANEREGAARQGQARAAPRRPRR